MSRRVVRTVCPRNCYCTCGMLATVEDGRLVRIEGDPANPATQGEVCVKGLSYVERVAHEDRLTSPLRRNKEGKLEPVSWDDALDEVAARLGRYQPDDVAVISSAKCTNEENYLVQKLARAVIGTHNVDHCARL